MTISYDSTRLLASVMPAATMAMQLRTGGAEAERGAAARRLTGDGELSSVLWYPAWKLPPIPKTTMRIRALPRVYGAEGAGPHGGRMEPINKMPLENLEEEGLPKNPDLRIAQLKFLLTMDGHRQDAAVKTELMDAITANNMAPYYEGLCKDLKWQLDGDLLSKMKKANEEELKRLDDVLEDAENSLGESEIRDAMMAKAEYLIRIGDKEGALTAFRKTYDKTVALGHRLDIVFYLLRIGLFYMDSDLITRNSEKAKRQML
ncbi:26S proteasome non-ATPase regulatory subunit 6 [Liparis tanakae]|uniref:26S proteasome non-ATPase regulatory subunit 6 n=1 Tax=Liparis tanakae TaxID=230148 RepID=A0A4Z2IU11_9TELE|nr:26S proteasome non-ATPase regulatory subunit 6 [Liparis tanakae]